MIAKIKNFPSEKEGEGKMGAFFMRILFRDLIVRIRIPRSLSHTLFRIPIRATHTPLSLFFSFFLFLVNLNLDPLLPLFSHSVFRISTEKKRIFSFLSFSDDDDF